MTGILIRKGYKYKEGRQPCENGGKDWSDAATRQGMPEMNRNWKKQRILP